MRKKHRKNHSYWLIKSSRSYTSCEIADLLGVHVHTVRSWRKVGLQTLPDAKTPLLFHGWELKRFLRDRRRSGRCQLAPGEFYCMRCREARKSVEGHLVSVATGKALGYSREQVIHKGKCAVCGAKMVRFGSQARSSGAFPEGNNTAGSNTVISEQLSLLQCGLERSKVCRE